MKTKKKWNVFALLLLVLMMLSSCGKANQKTLVVGTNPEFWPFEYINDEGKMDGFDIAFMDAIAKKAGYKVEWKNLEFKSLIGSIQTGGIDASIAGMTITEERLQSVDFSIPYYNASQVMVLRKDSNFTKLGELNGKKIAVQEGTTADTMVTPSEENKLITDPKTVVKRFKKGTDAILDLQNKSVDAVVIDKAPGQGFVDQNPDKLKLVVPTDADPEEYAIALPKNHEKLLNTINTAIEDLKKDGTFDKLVAKYITGQKIDVQQKSSNPFLSFLYQLKFVFLQGNRWVQIVSGLGTTILISLLAVIIGVILGLIAALGKLSYRSKGKKKFYFYIANAYIDIIRGTPTLVQLLIMYLVIFRSKAGLLAAILTFGINSGAYVAEIIRAGIQAVDIGQEEAGRSLGFTYGETMRYIILPQAVKNILPALGNEFITLIKETSIVGYVAIMDLTKASDFIISRTYDAFLPLIAVAIIYYALVKLLTMALHKFERRLQQSDRN